MAKKSLGRQMMSFGLMTAGERLGVVGTYDGRSGVSVAIAQVSPPLYYVLSAEGHGVANPPTRALPGSEESKALADIKARWGAKLQYPWKKGERWIGRVRDGYTAYECTSDYKTPKSAKPKRSVVLDRAQIRRDEEARLDRLPPASWASAGVMPGSFSGTRPKAKSKHAKPKRSVVLDRAQIRRDEEARLDRLHRHKAIVLPATGSILDDPSSWVSIKTRTAPRGRSRTRAKVRGNTLQHGSVAFYLEGYRAADRGEIALSDLEDPTTSRESANERKAEILFNKEKAAAYKAEAFASGRGRLAPPMHLGARKSTKASRARKAMPFGFSSRVLGMTFVYYGKTYKIKKLNARATKNQVDTTVIGESQSVVHQFDADQVKRALTKAGKSWKA